MVENVNQMEKEKETRDECEGWSLSNCCGAIIYSDTDICTKCKEHCSNMCEDCIVEDCDDRVSLY